MIPKYEDHVALWRDELKAWMPSSVFDAHVHLCPPEAMGAFSAARRREALATFDSFTWEQYSDLSSQLFSGKNVLGLFAFPLPLQEVDLDRANDYIIEIMRLDARVHGFLLADPEDPRPSIAAYERARKAGVPFIGVKPYSDLLGRSNFECTMPEFIPEGLLEFMDAEGLVMMLHTSGIGVGDAENRRYLRRVADQFPRIKIILAHMGRYVQTEQFFRFLDSGLLEDCPNLFLDISSASAPEIYERFLERKTLWPRLLFASDLPFGLITGVERWSATHGAIFVARDHYAWSDPQMELQFADERRELTYNTYHCIYALRQAFERLGLAGRTASHLKEAIFHGNVQNGILGQKGTPT